MNKALLFFQLCLPFALLGQPTSPPRDIVADYTAVKGPNIRMESFCVGAGRAGELLRKAAVDQLKDVHENCGFRYLRFHGLLHDELNVYSEQKGGQPVYNFQHIDLAYDAILDIGMKPFVELGFMPNQLASGTNTVFWWKANVTMPKDLGKWRALVGEFTRHEEERYGRDEVKSWFFEVWNEPNLANFFAVRPPTHPVTNTNTSTGTPSNSADIKEAFAQTQYFKLYDATVTAVKGVCPDYRVGGPATAGRQWIPELIAHCASNNAPLDFISTHDYATSSLLDEFGTKQHFLNTNPVCIPEGVQGVARSIAKSPMPRLPVYFTEWSTSPSSRDPVHDNYISAAFIVNSLKLCGSDAQAMSYWTYTDLFEEAGPAPSPFHGGFGLINLQGLHKPSYYAYKYLHQLGDEELACNDASATVCRDNNGIQALFWNYTQPHQDTPDKEFFKQDLPAANLPPVHLSLRNLPAGNYTLSLFGVGHHLNDVYGDFLAMGSPTHLTRQQIRELGEKNSGAPIREDKIIIGSQGTYEGTFPMRQNDVFLVTLRKNP